MRKLSTLRLVLFSSVTGLFSPLAAQTLVDDFTRSNSTTVGNGWTEGGGSRGEVNGNQLLFVTGGAAAREWITRSGSGYNTTLSSNSCTLTWAANLKLNGNTNPSGFDGSNYGNAFVLGATSADLTTGNGYAVVLGQSGATTT